MWELEFTIEYKCACDHITYKHTFASLYEATDYIKNNIEWDEHIISLNLHRIYNNICSEEDIYKQL